MNRIALSILVAASVATSGATGVICWHKGHTAGYANGRGDEREYESVKSIADVCYLMADKVEAIKTSKGVDDRGEYRNVCDQLMVTAHNNIAKDKDACFTANVSHEGLVPDETRHICPVTVGAIHAQFAAEKIG